MFKGLNVIFWQRSCCSKIKMCDVVNHEKLNSLTLVTITTTKFFSSILYSFRGMSSFNILPVSSFLMREEVKLVYM